MIFLSYTLLLNLYPVKLNCKFQIVSFITWCFILKKVICKIEIGIQTGFHIWLRIYWFFWGVCTCIDLLTMPKTMNVNMNLKFTLELGQILIETRANSSGLHGLVASGSWVNFSLPRGRRSRENPQKIDCKSPSMLCTL